MSRNFDFSQTPNIGITVLPDTTVLPAPAELLTVKTVTNGVVYLGFASPAQVSGAVATISDTPPVAAPGSLWWDSTGTGLYVRYNDGNSTQWVATDAEAAIGTVKISDTPPTAPDNALWWDSKGTGLYVRYNDGNSSQWVAAQNPYTLTDSPHDGATYARQSGNWTALPPPLAIVTTAVVNVLDHGAKGDGVTDDTAAIQAVLTTYAGKAVVFIPETGSTYRVNSLNIPTGTHLVLNGTLLAIVPATGTMLNFYHVNNIVIRGTGVADGNWANQPGGTQQAVVNIANCNKIYISEITMQNASLWNMAAGDSTHVRIDKVSLIGARFSNGFNLTSQDCWITNSFINGPTGADGGFAFYGGTSNSGALGNTVCNSTLHGIYIDADAGQPNPCSKITIANNIIYNCGNSGVWCDMFVTPAVTHRDIVISNNLCHDNGQAAAASDADIHVGNSFNVLVTGNSSDRMGRTAVVQRGISVTGGGGISVIGNSISHVGQGGTQGVGININGTGYLMVSGNSIYQFLSNTMQYSITGTAGSQNSFIGNFFDLPVNFSAASDTVAANEGAFDWEIGFDTSLGSAMAMNARAGSNANLLYKSGGVPRWAFGSDGTAETGGNSGSDLNLTSFTDGGTPQSPPPFRVSRASGKVTISTLNLSLLPTSATGLITGDVWRNGTVLNIV